MWSLREQEGRCLPGCRVRGNRAGLKLVRFALADQLRAIQTSQQALAIWQPAWPTMKGSLVQCHVNAGLTGGSQIDKTRLHTVQADDFSHFDRGYEITEKDNYSAQGRGKMVDWRSRDVVEVKFGWIVDGLSGGARTIWCCASCLTAS